MASPILLITDLSESQALKHVTINGQRDELEKIIGAVSITAPASGTLTLTESQARYGLITFTGTITGNLVVEIPAAMRHQFAVINSCAGAFTLRVRHVGGGAGFLVPPATGRVFRMTSGGLVDPLEVTKVPRGKAYRAGAQAIATATWTKVQLDTETADVGGTFDSATNYRMTVVTPGVYAIRGVVGLTGTGVVLKAAIYVNGAAVAQSGYGAAALDVAEEITYTQYLAEGDYVELWVRQDSGIVAAINVGALATALEWVKV